MTIKLRSHIVRAATPGNYRLDPLPLSRWPEAPRYCASCGCRLRSTNRARICDPCDDRARVAHEAAEAKRLQWLEERGV